MLSHAWALILAVGLLPRLCLIRCECVSRLPAHALSVPVQEPSLGFAVQRTPAFCVPCGMLDFIRKHLLCLLLCFVAPHVHFTQAGHWGEGGDMPGTHVMCSHLLAYSDGVFSHM